MIIQTEPIRCSKCHSTNVAKTVNRLVNVFVCLDCKHESGPLNEYEQPHETGTAYVYDGRRAQHEF